MKKSDTIVALAKERKEKREIQVLDEIKKMVSHNEKVSFYSVAKKTGASKSYLYNNDKIYNRITELRNHSSGKKTYEGKLTMIKVQSLRIKELECEVKRLKADNSESLQKRIHDLQEENNELRKQLKVAYQNAYN